MLRTPRSFRGGEKELAQSAETCKKLFVEIYSNHKVHIKVKEAVITIDAIGCQTNIIDAISQKNVIFV